MQNNGSESDGCEHYRFHSPGLSPRTQQRFMPSLGIVLATLRLLFGALANWAELCPAYNFMNLMPLLLYVERISW